jgi:hypothetical protein
MSRARRRALIALAAALVVHGALALHHRALRADWTGVPPAPPVLIAPAMALGDPQLFYRVAAFALQNMGDEGGRVTPLGDYDYGRLGDWLDLLDLLDPQARYAPTLAAYYFGQTPDPDDLRRIIAYLIRVGARDPAHNWRWLTHAAYLARHRLKDLPLALEVARHLAGLPEGEVPLWVRQMPAFVMAEVGEREAARDLMATIRATDTNLSPDEVALIDRFIDAQDPARPPNAQANGGERR